MEKPKRRALHKIEEPTEEEIHAVGQQTKTVEGKTVLDSETGTRFFHKHLSRKAKKKKAQGRAQARRSRQRNRRRK